MSMAAAQVLVSNLKFDVTDESELVELFGGPKSVIKAEVRGEEGGRAALHALVQEHPSSQPAVRNQGTSSSVCMADDDLSRVRGEQIHFDRNGRSLGTAELVFYKQSEALEAVKKFDKRTLDGKPMSVRRHTSDTEGTGPGLMSVVRCPRACGGGVQVKLAGRDGMENPLNPADDDGDAMDDDDGYQHTRVAPPRRKPQGGGGGGGGGNVRSGLFGTALNEPDAFEEQGGGRMVGGAMGRVSATSTRTERGGQAPRDMLCGQ